MGESYILSNFWYQKWIINGTEAGQFKKTNILIFLRVYEVSHTVLMDQPYNSFEMLRLFINKEF